MIIRKYQASNQKYPLDEWLNKLRDKRAKSRILLRLERLKLGLFGDWKSVGNGVYELRIDTGKGYRVYYGKEGETVVLLLVGGDKSSQPKDIKQATGYWNDYKENNND